jgi:hypothetical protein
MAATSTTIIKELSDKGSDGTRLGQSAADLISFHGVPPVAQSAVVTLETTVSASVVASRLASVIACLVAHGLLASA